MPVRFGWCWVSVALGIGGCRGGDPADLVLRRGAIYPVAADTLHVETLAVRDGRVVYLGPDAAAGSLIGRATRVIELAGRMVLPGFRDTHVHPRGGLGLAECPLDGLPEQQAVLDSLARCVRAASPGDSLRWFRARGWELPVFPEANPRKEWLDALLPSRPAYLVAADGHSAWVNSRALALAGLSRVTPDPAHGRIERDPATGEPSGTLRESAMELVGRLLPARTQAEIRAGLERGLALAAEHGIVAVVDASADPGLLEAYAALDSLDRLAIRVVAAIRADPAAGAPLDSLRAWRGRYPGRRVFSPTAAKIFVDGVIEAGTAALLEPYLGGPAGRGEPNLDPAMLDSLVAALDAAGFQVHQHAIGDRAVRLALDAIAFAARHNGARDARHTIAHLQLIDSADLPRFAELGVVPSIQPLWAYRDDYITRLTEPVLGPARSSRIYPNGALARGGAPLAVGSDWPVSSIDPLRAIQVAVTRRGPEQGDGPAWLPDERLSLGRILEAYTAGGAYAMGMEAGFGTLELGKIADLVILDRDLYRIPTHEIHRARVLLTVVGGQEVWRARSLH